MVVLFTTLSEAARLPIHQTSKILLEISRTKLPSFRPIDDNLKLSAIPRSAFLSSQPRRDQAAADGIDSDDQSVTLYSTTENGVDFESPNTDDESDEDPTGDSQEAHGRPHMNADSAFQDGDAIDSNIDPNDAIDAKYMEESILRHSHQAAHDESQIIVDLLVSHIQGSDPSRENMKKRSFDDYMEDQFKKARQSINGASSKTK
ncbi:hypothetical protein DL98DRAFT_577936 [Cadophora sp. DSE1049]|nr:hypothetical protein DL98DRAFT_577936 [Cadophora sp. DSE1049]